MIVGNPIGCILKHPDTFVVQDKSGQEYPAVMVEEEEVFTAGLNDIRKGKTAATSVGMVEGEKVIPAYHTNEGMQIIANGKAIKITSLKSMDLFDYTKLLAIVCDFNTNFTDSVASRNVSINDNVYAVLSTIPLSEVVINKEEKSIDLGIKNETGKPQILRFITYKEII